MAVAEHRGMIPSWRIKNGLWWLWGFLVARWWVRWAERLRWKTWPHLVGHWFRRQWWLKWDVGDFSAGWRLAWFLCPNLHSLCPNCAEVFDWFEEPWFSCYGSGYYHTADTGPVHWASGVQTCPRCRHRFPVEDSS